MKHEKTKQTIQENFIYVRYYNGAQEIRNKQKKIENKTGNDKAI